MAADPGRSHYTILGVAPRATSKEIRVAYLNLARALHPDRVRSGSPGEQRLAERRMREVNEAYEVLSDTAKRQSYDRARSTSPGGNAASANRTGSPTNSGSSGAGPTPPRPRGNPERFDADPAWRDDEGRLRHQVWLDEDVEVSPLVAFLIRRGPILVAILLAVVLFIGTAYAGGPADDPADVRDPTVTTPTSQPCSGAPITGVSGGSVVVDPC